MIPHSFEEWKKCIVNDCHINLSPDFAQKRLTVFQDRGQLETQKFIQLYGEQHLQNIINWLKQI
jgi:hypothetical protein